MRFIIGDFHVRLRKNCLCFGIQVWYDVAAVNPVKSANILSIFGGEA